MRTTGDIQTAIKGEGARARAGWLSATVSALALALIQTPQPALAQAAAQTDPAALAQTEQTYSFDITSQPLPQALAEVSAVTGLQILYSEAAAGAHIAPALNGSFTAEQALDRLVAGSGFQYRYTGANAVTLEPDIAQDDGGLRRLGPVTVTASRTERSIAAIPGSVSVVDTDAVETQSLLARPSSPLADIITNSVPGFTPNRTDTDGVTLRGRSPLILIDGIPQNQQIRSSGFEFTKLNPATIDRIEVVRGANATYGTGGQGGIINIITKKGGEGAPKFTTSVGTSFSLTHPADSWSPEIYQDVSGSFGDTGYRLGVSGSLTGSNFSPDGDRLPTSRSSDRRVFGLDAGLNHQINEQQSISLKLNYSRREQRDFFGRTGGTPGGSFPTVTDNSSLPLEIEENYFNGFARYANEDVWGSAVSAEIFGMNNDVDQPAFVAGATIDQFLISENRIGSRLNVETPVNLPLFGTSQLVWGADVQRYEYERERAKFDPISGTTDTQVNVPQVTQWSYAGFAQLELPLGDFLFSGGVRHERFKAEIESSPGFEGGDIPEFDVTLFNAGVVYFVDANIELFGGFSQGADIPELGRAASITTSADLLRVDAAKTDQFELGVRGTYSQVQGSLSAFYTESELAARTQQNPAGPDFPSVPLRQPEEIWGIEATLDVQPSEQWALGGIFTYQDGLREDEDTGDISRLQNTFISPVRLTAYTEYSPFEWWRNRLQATYSFERDPFGNDRTTRDLGPAESYFTLDYFASFDVGPGNLDVGVNNIFNEEYVTPLRNAQNVGLNYFPDPGTSATIRYTLNW